ncbi:MAG: OB-fold domain-containing protein [Rhodospirillales bacterium]|nr:OB-fold domain-containing protein [Rhodospirillales bacterium]
MSDNPFAGNGPEKYFRDGLEAGEYRLQFCDDCAKNIYYPRAVCNHCGSANTSWRLASGKGSVYSTSVERGKPEAGGDKNLALIDLEEGGRLMSRVVECAPTDVTIGMAVEAFIGDVDGAKLILFRPAGEI